MLWVCRPSESLAEDLQEFSGFPGGFADFCGQVERELLDLSGFVAERVRTPVKERGLGAGSLLRRNTPPYTLWVAIGFQVHFDLRVCEIVFKVLRDRETPSI
jgi:hypothetical protein